MMFKELKNKDIKILKEQLYKQNNGKCPLLNIPVPLDNMALDHNHKKNDEPYSKNKGTIRNAIEFRANAMEGKIFNNWKRYYGADESKHPITLSEFLRNLADYLEAEPYSEDNSYFIHPTEVPKIPKMTKRCYNKLKKVYDGKAKFPEYPKLKKLTKQLEKLFGKYNVEIEYYS